MFSSITYVVAAKLVLDLWDLVDEVLPVTNFHYLEDTSHTLSVVESLEAVVDCLLAGSVETYHPFDLMGRGLRGVVGINIYILRRWRDFGWIFGSFAVLIVITNVSKSSRRVPWMGFSSIRGPIINRCYAIMLNIKVYPVQKLRTLPQKAKKLPSAKPRALDISHSLKLTALKYPASSDLWLTGTSSLSCFLLRVFRSSDVRPVKLPPRILFLMLLGQILKHVLDAEDNNNVILLRWVRGKNAVPQPVNRPHTTVVKNCSM